MTGEIGGKARGLELLLHNTDLGFNVPKFAVVDTSYFDYIQKQGIIAGLLGIITKQPYSATRLPSEFDVIVADLMQRFQGGDLIARSSSLREDGEHSFAGKYHSEIAERATAESLAKALFSVYSSMNTPKAVDYRQEHGIEDDKMAVVVQEFIEPDWSGVMYTSHPSYPKDLSIEFIQGRNNVVEGAEGSHIIEYYKGSKKRIFESEDLPSELPFDVDGLARIGMALEKRIGASDIEFIVKNGQFYFIQRREITDLQEPTRVRVPKYKPEQFIGSTRLKRGTGKVTLPVVDVEDVEDLMDAEMQLLINIDPEEALKHINDYFSGIMRHDEQFSSGYILLLPHFHQTLMPIYLLLTTELGIKGEPSYDNLTPHKRAIITTRHASISSHVMTAARERGIPYAGFRLADDLFNKVQTGDVLSIYFQGREAKVFLEESPLRSIHETNPQVSFDIIPGEGGYVSVKASTFLDGTKYYTDDFLLYLNTATGQEWRFKPFDLAMGGAFVNPKGRHVLMSIFKITGQYHQWRFNQPEECRHLGYKPLTKKQLLPLIDGYVEHLKSSDL